MRVASYTVIAGKYDGFEENIKYIESFDNIDDALKAYSTCLDYPFHRIELDIE